MIPQPTDQIAHRKRLGSKGGRSSAFDRTAYQLLPPGAQDVA
ncbi:hypothetical protein ACFV2Q_23215 [Streptomyces sp. NPDC059650]